MALAQLGQVHQTAPWLVEGKLRHVRIGSESQWGGQSCGVEVEDSMSMPRRRSATELDAASVCVSSYYELLAITLQRVFRTTAQGL